MGAASVDHLPLLDAEAARTVLVVRGRVHHERRVGVVERTRVQQVHLAAEPLLGGGAEHGHPQPGGLRQRRQDESGTDRGRRDDVVAAGVSDLGQGVVLRAQDDVGVPGAEAGGEGSGQSVGTALDLDPGLLEDARAPVHGAVLLVGQLRVCGDRVGEADDGAAVLLEGVGHLPQQAFVHAGCAHMADTRRLPAGAGNAPPGGGIA